MPATNASLSERRDALRALLKSGPQPNQQRLVDALRRQGFAATQSSISRDLKELGAVKMRNGYELPEPPEAAVAAIGEMAGLLRQLTQAGPHLLVVHTAIGAAQRVALALDRTGWNDIVGTVAGDDTLFVATASASQQRRVQSRLRKAMHTADSRAGGAA